MNSLRPRMPHMHQIALRQIFEQTLPPPGILGHALSRGPESAWSHSLRTIKSIALVSKAWHAVALPLLYRHVVLRRVGQIIAFARTIRSSPDTFARHVRAVVVACEVPTDLVRVTRQSLAYIFELCRNLRSLSFQAAFPLVPVLRFTSTAKGSSLHGTLQLPTTITQLHIYDDEYAEGRGWKYPLQSVLSRITPLNNLVSLTIYTLAESSSVHHSVQFPNLETLCLRTTIFGSYLPVHWEMPKLKSLRFRPMVTISQISRTTLTEFMQRHGEGILNLDFGGSQDSRCVEGTLEAQMHAASLCPRLDHFVIQPVQRWSVGLTVSDLASGELIIIDPVYVVTAVVSMGGDCRG